MVTLRRELLFWLLGGMIVCTLVGGFVTYRRVDRSVMEMFDYQLSSVAANLPARIQAQPEPPDDGDPDNDVLIEIWNTDGQLVYPEHPTVTLAQPTEMGFSHAIVGGAGWRIYAVRQPGRLVEIAQPMAARQRLAASFTVRAILPFFLLIPFLIVLIWFVVGRALRPLDRVARALGDRSPQLLEPVAVMGLPQEIKPLITALNALLGRLEHALRAQRDFIADAAHELRSPLTALRLQLQLAERARTDDQRATAFAKLHERLDRSTHLIEQLLTLAREEPRTPSSPVGDINLAELVRQVAFDHTALAQHRGISLEGRADVEPLLVRGQRESLRVMLGNIVDNAVRYTTAGGLVRIVAGLDGVHPQIRVTDTGPGIPEAERARVFDRFYRREGSAGSGSGLGLAIVRTIAQHHQCRVELEDRVGGAGLVVTITFEGERPGDAATVPELASATNGH
jgi:two-component system OmpR family sensor kinase